MLLYRWKGMVVNSGNWGSFGKNTSAAGGEAAVAPRGELRLAGADAGMTQAVDRHSWTRSIGPPWTAQGV
jgi:hypothetical protein